MVSYQSKSGNDMLVKIILALILVQIEQFLYSHVEYDFANDVNILFQDINLPCILYDGL